MKGKVMRIRQRYFVAALIAAVSLAISTAPTPSAAVSAIGSDTHYCPAGTAWDNFRQRCV
jgi:hypothetical protein